MVKKVKSRVLKIGRAGFCSGCGDFSPHPDYIVPAPNEDAPIVCKCGAHIIRVKDAEK